MFDRLLALIPFVLIAYILVFILQYNLETFCTYPDRPGNWVVQPFCN